MADAEAENVTYPRTVEQAVSALLLALPAELKGRALVLTRASRAGMMLARRTVPSPH